MSRYVLPIVVFLVHLVWLSAASAQTRTFVDGAGRTVEVPERIERVMAAGPPASVLLYALAPDRMAGWVMKLSDEARPFIGERWRDLPVHGRLTGRGGTANIEAVLAMKPDLIVDVGVVDATYASLADRVQEQTGIPYVLIDGRFGQTAETLRTFGDLLGERERAAALAGYAEDAMARLAAIVAGVPEESRPRVYYGRGPQGLETGLSGSINTEMLEVAGAVNVASSAGAGGLANVSVEQVLAWNPDVILTLDPGFHAAVRTDPMWSQVAAVRNGRVHRVPTLPFGWFDAPPGVNRLMSAWWLAGVLYPDRVDVDLVQRTREFYRLFYHVELEDSQIDALIGGAQGMP